MISSLVSSLFKPHQERHSEAVRVVGGCVEPDEAWRALVQSEILPKTWLDDTRRRFPWLRDLTRQDRHQKLRWAPNIPVAPHPDSVEECAVISSFVRPMEQAENHARKFLQRLATWGFPQPSVILWVPTSPELYGYQLTDTKPGVWEPSSALGILPRTQSGRNEPWNQERLAEINAQMRAEVGEEFQYDAIADVVPWVFANERWLSAVSEGEAISHRNEPHLAKKPYEALKNPFEPVLKIFECGFGLLPSNEQFLVLGYPEQSPGSWHPYR